MRIGILGAGLLGVAVALECAARGIQVDLIEQDHRALNRASLRNEGKVHLGFVYAMDPTLATARAMLRGALSFGPLLARWTAGEFRQVRRSRPFSYVVPNDSLLSMADLAGFYERLQGLYDEEARTGAVDYLGTSPDRLWWPDEAGAYRRFVHRDAIQGGFGTVESALDLPVLATTLARHVHSRSGLDVRLGHRIEAVERQGAGFEVYGTDARGEPWRRRYDQVVNALWDGRLAIDAQLGLAPERAWVHRLKYRILVDLPPKLRHMPSMTFVLGPYGDVVTYGKGLAYVSWYPECMRGWSTDPAPPEAWGRHCRGETLPHERVDIAKGALEAFDALIPGLARSTVRVVDAGAIFAWGQRDIDVVDSELHQRDRIGVHSVRGYHSVNTGKLTTAPLFALETVEAIVRHARGAA